MAEIPDYQSMMLPIMRRAATGEINTKAAVETVAAEFHLTPEDLSALLPSGTTTRAVNRVSWAMIYLERAGLLKRERRGVYSITERGREVLAGAPAGIDNQLLRKFSEFQHFLNRRSSDASEGQKPLAAEEDVASKITPSERLEEAHKALAATLRLELIDRILVSSPTFFEKMMVKLLTAMGYGGETIEEAAAHIGGPGDGGVDGVIWLDALGIDKVYIQAKRYARDAKVGRKEVQAFSGALDDKQTTRGVFVTTSDFTAEAVNYVKSIPKQIVLINGDRLSELLVRYGVGVRVERTIEVKKLDEDFFEEV